MTLQKTRKLNVLFETMKKRYRDLDSQIRSMGAVSMTE